MRDDDTLIYVGIGPMAAIVLGVALMPLRDLTIASNFTLAFLALTIVVGELGGRSAALATAIVSALSLDFFLTAPYLHLAIHGKDDVIAFVSLVFFGVLAATLGSSRRSRLAIWRQLGVLQGAATRGADGGPAEPRLQTVTDAALATFPLAAVVVRDPGNRLLARSGNREKSTLVPHLVESPQDLVSTPPHREWRDGGTPLPDSGLRVPLMAAGRQLGWLDLWGDGRPLSRDARRVLAALAAVLGLTIDAQLHSQDVAAR